LFFGLGILWLFLFSLPVGKGKSLYEVLHYYIVDTQPVHWIVDKAQGGYEATIEKTETTNETLTLRGKETLSQSSDVLKGIE
jgi:hypothetical protein